MTYGRELLPNHVHYPDGAVVSHLAELVRGTSLPRGEGPLIRPSATFSPRGEGTPKRPLEKPSRWRQEPRLGRGR